MTQHRDDYHGHVTVHHAGSTEPVAVLLREAARVLRELSRHASDQPWAIWADLTDDGFVHVGELSGVIPDGQSSIEGEHNPVAKVYTDEQAAYIATMHPVLGLVLADALADEATRPPNALSPILVQLADLILGGVPALRPTSHA